MVECILGGTESNHLNRFSGFPINQASRFDGFNNNQVTNLGSNLSTDTFNRSDDRSSLDQIGQNLSSNSIIQQVGQSGLGVKFSVKSVFEALKAGGSSASSLVSDLREAQGTFLSTQGFGQDVYAIGENGELNKTALINSAPTNIGSTFLYTAPGTQEYDPIVTAGQVITAALDVMAVDPQGALGGDIGIAEGGGLTPEARERLLSQGISEDVINQFSEVSSQDASQAEQALEKSPEMPRELAQMAAAFEELNERRTQNIQAGQQLRQQVRGNTGLSQPNIGGGAAA